MVTLQKYSNTSKTFLLNSMNVYAKECECLFLDSSTIQYDQKYSSTVECFPQIVSLGYDRWQLNATHSKICRHNWKLYANEIESSKGFHPTWKHSENWFERVRYQLDLDHSMVYQIKVTVTVAGCIATSLGKNTDKVSTGEVLFVSVSSLCDNYKEYNENIICSIPKLNRLNIYEHI